MGILSPVYFCIMSHKPKEGTDLLKLKLQMGVNCQVGAGN